MPNGNGMNTWRAIALVSITANVTGFGAFATWAIAASDHVTITDVEKTVDTAIAGVDFPYEDDRRLVRAHLADVERHESDAAKRGRIREALETSVQPALTRIERRLDSMEDHLLGRITP